MGGVCLQQALQSSLYQHRSFLLATKVWLAFYCLCRVFLCQASLIDKTPHPRYRRMHGWLRIIYVCLVGCHVVCAKLFYGWQLLWLSDVLMSSADHLEEPQMQTIIQTLSQSRHTYCMWLNCEPMCREPFQEEIPKHWLQCLCPVKKMLSPERYSVCADHLLSRTQILTSVTCNPNLPF